MAAPKDPKKYKLWIQRIKANHPSKDLRRRKRWIKKLSEATKNYIKKHGVCPERIEGLRRTKGRRGWSKGLTAETDERVKRGAEGKKGKSLSLKTRRKMGKAQKKRFQNPAEREKFRIVRAGMNVGKKNGMYGVKGEAHPWWGKKHSEKTKRKMKKAQTKEKIEKRIRATMLTLCVKPNKKELQLLHLLQTNELPYKFVGDGVVWFGSKNPDFINTDGQKKLIEFYGDYWHHRPGAKKNDEKRLKIFRNYGFKTLVIWEHELKDEKTCLLKIKRFHAQDGEMKIRMRGGK